MNLNSQIKLKVNKGFLILWAAAIFWFYLGNLINFHQNRIWGKILIPSCFTHSSINKNSVSDTYHVDYDKSGDHVPSTHLVADEIELSSLISIEVLSVKEVLDVSSESVTYSPLLLSILLRGPPTV